MRVLSEIAVEGSTYVVTCTFADEDDNAIVPVTAVSWRLLDNLGNQISTGSETAAATVNIVLTGSDIVVAATSDESDAVLLTLVISTTYNSSHGNGLTLVEAVNIPVVNLKDTP